MTLLEIVVRAISRGLLPKRLSPGSTQIILLDDDGLIVSVNVTHDLMRGSGSRPYMTNLMTKLLEERARLRSGL